MMRLAKHDVIMYVTNQYSAWNEFEESWVTVRNRGQVTPLVILIDRNEFGIEALNTECSKTRACREPAVRFNQTRLYKL